MVQDRPDTAQTLRGTPFGPFTLLEPVGEGGFAVVYRACGPGRSTAAVKVLRDAYRTNARVQSDFVREARLHSSLSHENIATCYGLFREGSRLAIALEFVEGSTFRSLCRGPERFEENLPFLFQIALALRYLHGEGIVHLDLKPGNVLVDGTGRTKLIDFCLAFRSSFLGKLLRRFRRRAIPGSPSYMAPEVIRGEVPDHRADLYSLGVITYWALTGKLPFSGSARKILRDHTLRIPTAPSRLNPRVPPALEALTFRLLAKDPAERLDQADEYCRELLATGLLQPSLCKPGVQPD